MEDTPEVDVDWAEAELAVARWAAECAYCRTSRPRGMVDAAREAANLESMARSAQVAAAALGVLSLRARDAAAWWRKVKS